MPFIPLDQIGGAGQNNGPRADNQSAPGGRFVPLSEAHGQQSEVQPAPPAGAPAQITTNQAPKPPKQEEQGSSFGAGVVSAMQGPAMGWYDEAVGATGALVEGVGNLTPWGTGRSMGEAYKHHRDATRATIAGYEKENPISSQVERAVVSGASAVINPFGATTKAIAGTGGTMTQAARLGAASGAVTGLGDSTADTGSGMAKDTAIGAATGAVAGPAIAGALGAGTKAVQNIAGRMGLTEYTPVQQAAMRKVGDAIERDAMNGRPGLSDYSGIPAARLNTLGDEAAVADLGQNTKGLLDTLATLPGQTKPAAERLIHDRQAGRAGRMIEAAREGLSPGGERLPETLLALDEARKLGSAPLYDRVRRTDIQMDNGLSSILERAQSAFGEARKLAAINGDRFDLDNPTGGLNTLLTGRQSKVPLSQLDTLKRTLFDLEQGHINPETGRLNEMGQAYRNLRRDLVGALDKATTDPVSGKSFYKMARDAYAGPSELRAAANQGYQSLTKDGWKIKEAMEGMSPGELQAFRIGAFEALSKKLGTEGGQTQILKLWKEPATADKLREVFKNQILFRNFAANMAAESRLKGLESVGRGSQTASRAAGMGDLDVSGAVEAGSAARNAVAGNVTGVLSAAANAWNRVSTTEPVRDEMGRLLLQQGDKGRSVVARIQEQRRLRQEAERIAAAAGGVMGGTLQSTEATPVPPSPELKALNREILAARAARGLSPETKKALVDSLTAKREQMLSGQ